MADKTAEAGTLTDTDLNTLIETQSKSTNKFSFFKAPVTNTDPFCDVNIRDVFSLIKGQTYSPH